MVAPNLGLEDVVVGTSTICDVNGKTGQLIYRGYDIHDLVAHTTFEEVVYLLWHEDLPTRAQLTEIDTQLKVSRALPDSVIDLMKKLPKDANAMDVLRTVVSYLGILDPDGRESSLESTKRKALRLTAQIPTAVGAWGRIREGKDPVASDRNLSAAANLLYMLTGAKPDD